VEFYEKYLQYRDRDLVHKYLDIHNNLGTMFYALDNDGEVIGVCRWNINDNGTIAKIIDLAIRPDYRGKGVGKHFLIRGLKLWTKVTHLEFERGVRGDHRLKLLPVEAILKHNFF
jgi:N-acetylglutamate synthase-like GNAT family acetyltransferase